MEHDENATGINWLFYAPQFHVGIAIVALVCLGFTISTWDKVKRTEKKITTA